MEKNEGRVDRIIRGVLAVVFLWLGLAYSYWFLILTVVLGVTAATGFCLPYKWLGISTLCSHCEKSKKK